MEFYRNYLRQTPRASAVRLVRFDLGGLIPLVDFFRKFFDILRVRVILTKFHINDKGNIYPCRAQTHCRFGDFETGHYASQEAAMKAYEEIHRNNQIPDVNKKAWSDFSLETLQDLEIQTFEEKFRTGKPYTDDEYNRHREYIRKVDATYPSTHKIHTRQVKGKSVYAEERLVEQEKVLNTLKARFAHVPAEGKVIFSGGPPGAGKTTFLHRLQGDDLKNYAVVNPDEVKEEMIKAGMAPIIPGLAPLETNSLIHYEAAVITERLYADLRAEKKNILVDKTMGSASVILKEIDALKSSGYVNVAAVFVDVDPDVAYERIVRRHREGLDTYVKTGGKTLGERAVKGTIVSGSRTEDENFYSKNSIVFDSLSKGGHFMATQYFDNNAFQS